MANQHQTMADIRALPSFIRILFPSFCVVAGHVRHDLSVTVSRAIGGGGFVNANEAPRASGSPS